MTEEPQVGERRWASVSRSVAGVAGLGLALVGAGLILISTSSSARIRISRSGGDQPVSAGAGDQGNIEANNSPVLARDPSYLALANRIDTPRYSCALTVSHDGGRTWSAVPVPLASGERECYAPDVVFAADGTLYMSYVTLVGAGNVPDAVWLVRSTDGGSTLSSPTRVLGRLAFQVRLTADPAHPTRLYLTWLQATTTGLYSLPQTGNPIEVSRSDDGGATWSAPVRVSSAARLRVLAPAPAIGPRGQLYVLYLDVGGDRLDYEGADQGFGGPPYNGRFTLVLARSLDAGQTWSESVVDDSIVPTRRFVVFLPPYPALAVDRRTGRIYAAFEDSRLGDPDVWLWTFTPGARTWSRPTRVNDTPAGDGTWQYLPALSVAPDGRLDVLYYDRRADPSNHLDAVSLQSSFDHGRRFTPHITLTDRPFDSRIGFGSERGLPDLGSQLALLSTDPGARAAWADTRYGTVVTNKQVIESARASFTTAGGLPTTIRDLLRYGGLAFVVLALALGSAVLRGLALPAAAPRPWAVRKRARR